jgi:Protein of unknown function (DUF4236)
MFDRKVQGCSDDDFAQAFGPGIDSAHRHCPVLHAGIITRRESKMGLRYRSSIGRNFFHFNFSGSGISVSVGPRGYSSVNYQLVNWLGRRKRRPRLNVNLPLGFSYTTPLGEPAPRHHHIMYSYEPYEPAAAELVAIEAPVVEATAPFTADEERAAVRQHPVKFAVAYVRAFLVGLFDAIGNRGR